MNSVRVIKKYPNRRLYDTEESRYITLADVRGLVLDKIEFAVIDKKSGEDITRTILLQVICEQEQQGEAIMSQGFLSQVIRSYADVVPEFIATYLEQCLQRFVAQQQGMRGQAERTPGADPVASVADSTELNFKRWKSSEDPAFQHVSSATRQEAGVDDDALPADCKKAS